jgi:hypothetical protein
LWFTPSYPEKLNQHRVIATGCVQKPCHLVARLTAKRKQKSKYPNSKLTLLSLGGTAEVATGVGGGGKLVGIDSLD